MTSAMDKFRRKALEAQGFHGWVTFGDLGELLKSGVSKEGGIYVVVCEGGAAPDYLRTNPGGRFKGRDPTVKQDALAANWVADAEVVYIGKANSLRRRLGEYMRFGRGVPIGHWGGRLIWQLADSAGLLVAWRETPGQVPKDVETALIAQFRDAYGKPPFANEPHRLGA